jgi:hypothetical protein
MFVSLLIIFLRVTLLFFSLKKSLLKLFSEVFLSFFSSFVFFIGYSLYLHFKFPNHPQPLFHSFPPPTSMRVLPHPLQPTPSISFPILGHWTFPGPRASSPTDAWQSHPLLLCSWSHGSLHVYCLVGGPVPGSSRGSGLLTVLLPPWVYKPPQSLLSLLQHLQQRPPRSRQWLAAKVSRNVLTWVL